MENIPDCCPACGKEVTTESKEAPCPYCDRPLWFLRRTMGDVVILTFLPGPITGSEGFDRFREVLAAFSNASRVVLNLAHLPFIGSVFLGMLVTLRKRLMTANGELKICGVQPLTSAVFKVTKLDTLFDICVDERSALEGF